MTTISHPKKEDIDRVVAFMNACDTAEFGLPDTDLADQQEQWDNMDLSRDAWIALENGSIVGFSCVNGSQNRIDFDLNVYGTLSPAGLGIELVHLCETRAHEMLAASPDWHPAYMVGYASQGNSESVAAFGQNGFKVETYQFRMQIDFNLPIEEPTWPQGYSLRPFQAGDEQALYDLVQSAFDWPGHVVTPFNEWHSALFRGGRFDPECFVTLWQGERLVGAALSYDDSGRGWIRQLVIAKEQQGKGLGSRLLQHMFTFYQSRGAVSVALGVASRNSKAGEFYERCGMHRSREFLEFHKEL